jgi:hypothetical protein
LATLAGSADILPKNQRIVMEIPITRAHIRSTDADAAYVDRLCAIEHRWWLSVLCRNSNVQQYKLLNMDIQDVSKVR